MENTLQPLLLTNEEEDEQNVVNHRQTSSFVAEGDIQPINTTKDFFSEFLIESKKLWLLAAPAIFTCLFQYALSGVSQIIVGHVGTLELAAFSVQILVVSGFTYGIMLGMGSALETLCGQAYGAGQLDMMGIYMQRSGVILFVTALILTPIYIFTTPLLKLIGQEDSIAESAGKIALWMLPEIFALVANFPMVKFLQAQSKMIAMWVIAFVALVAHVFLNWLLVLKLGWGLVAAVLLLVWSWWFIAIAQFLYIISGTCGEAWTGFSIKAFENLWGFVKLSVASAVMICLEMWYYTALVLFAGYLKNPEIAVDALSICINILSATIMVAFGFNAATSVRVSNELGAGHPRTAKFSVVVVVLSSFILGLIISLILIITRYQYPYAFTSSPEVRDSVIDLTPFLAFSVLINYVQPVISGVAIGAGWQGLVAYVNIACYYLFGVPLGLVLGYAFNLGVKGIWFGMLAGTVVQTFILLYISYRTDWNKEVLDAESRMQEWKRNTKEKVNDTGKMYPELQ